MKKLYRIKHVPTGLYYKPGNENLSEKHGKIYQTGANILTYDTSGIVSVEIMNINLIKKYDPYLSKYRRKSSLHIHIYDIPSSEFIKEYVGGWEIIPEDKLNNILGNSTKTDILCDCGELNKDLEGYPYAYDRNNDYIIYSHKCRCCGKIQFSKK